MRGLHARAVADVSGVPPRGAQPRTIPETGAGACYPRCRQGIRHSAYPAGHHRADGLRDPPLRPLAGVRAPRDGHVRRGHARARARVRRRAGDRHLAPHRPPLQRREQDLAPVQFVRLLPGRGLLGLGGCAHAPVARRPRPAQEAALHTPVHPRGRAGALDGSGAGARMPVPEGGTAHRTLERGAQGRDQRPLPRLPGQLPRRHTAATHPDG